MESESQGSKDASKHYDFVQMEGNRFYILIY